MPSAWETVETCQPSLSYHHYSWYYPLNLGTRQPQQLTSLLTVLVILHVSLLLHLVFFSLDVPVSHLFIHSFNKVFAELPTTHTHLSQPFLASPTGSTTPVSKSIYFFCISVTNLRAGKKKKFFSPLDLTALNPGPNIMGGT